MARMYECGEQALAVPTPWPQVGAGRLLDALAALRRYRMIHRDLRYRYTITVEQGFGGQWSYRIKNSTWKGAVVAPAIGDHVDAIHAAAQHLRQDEGDALSGGHTG